jgi:hypothetical protein
MLRWWLILLGAFLLSASSPPTRADSTSNPQVPLAEISTNAPQPVDRVKQAITHLAQADADFALQGEYMGHAQGPWRGAGLTGLQVVSLGDGKFQGILLRGGLPGAGWDRQTKLKLAGERHLSTAVLRGEELEITVTGNSALLRHRGQRIGQIRKWQRISGTQDAYPPPGAVVLFDGRNTSQLQNAKVTADRLLEVGASTKMPVGDFQLHLEFRTPYMPFARGQGRGNSGVYIQQRYEVQILDSFGLDGADNECGGLYKQRRPAVNMCLPPLAWQTYDIYFTAARFNNQSEKVRPARITVLHNGEPVHWNYELAAKTGGGKPEGPEQFPILLQNHNNPVNYRNIWIVPIQESRPCGWQTASHFLPSRSPSRLGRRSVCHLW